MCIILIFYTVVIQGGLERIALNVYHFLGVIGKMDIAKSQWNVDAKMDIMETSASMLIVPQAVIHNMDIAYIQILAGAIQVIYNIFVEM